MPFLTLCNRTSRRKPGTGKTPPPVMPKSLTMPVSSGGLKKLAEGKDSEGKDGVIEKRTKKAPVDTPAQQKPSSEQEPGSSRKLPSFLRKQESRLASISKMQERLLKRLSRRSKEAPEMRERPSNQYWSSAPRIMYDGSSIGPSSLVRSSSMRHGPPKTVSAQFQLSLILLVERLEKTNPFFVRCIKSNGEKVPSLHLPSSKLSFSPPLSMSLVFSSLILPPLLFFYFCNRDSRVLFYYPFPSLPPWTLSPSLPPSLPLTLI